MKILSNVNKNDFSNYIINFIQVLSEDKLIDLNLLYKNLESLKIYTVNNIKDYNIFRKGKTTAYYCAYENSITIEKSNINSSFYHEMFHVASSYDNGISYSGLSQISFKLNIGTFLNEGYTELLRQRYFPTKENDLYEFETNVAAIIEEIVGKEKMYTCYFKADLPKLINYLSEYATKEEIILFLKQNTKIKSNRFIKQIYFKKLKEDYNNGLITKYELISKIQNYVEKFEKHDIDYELYEFFGEELFCSRKEKSLKK